MRGRLLALGLAAACGGAEVEEGSGTEAARSASAVAPQSAVELVGAGVVSTEANQTFPSQDPRTGDLWFSTYEDAFDDQTILVARRVGDGWAAPEVAPFSGTWGDRAPRFSPDGGALYITSNRPAAGGAEAGDMNVWRLERAGDGWTEPVLVEGAVNSAGADIHPAVTEQAIWLASVRPDGLGRSDLYRVADDGTVTHLPAPLNSELSHPDLWVSADESWMVLAITDHPDGLGGDDLWVSRRQGEGWSAPVNLGPDVNTPDYEYGPSLSADGEWLLFTSHRGGSANVYRVPLAAVEAVRDGAAIGG